MVADRDKRGYVPIFLDATAIEVKGENFEGADTIYDGRRALWLYATFIGRLQVSGRLARAKLGVVGDWRKQLRKDVAPLIPKGLPVWISVDNAYYQKKFVDKVRKHGWDFSMSLTDVRVKSAIIDQIDENAVRTPIPDKDDDDVEVQERMVKPSKWTRAHRCIVIRRWMKKEGEQDLLPTHIVVMTSLRSLR